jgi:hypothetical protein
MFNPIFYKNQEEVDDEEDYLQIICDMFMTLTPKVKDIYCVYDALLSIHKFISNALKHLPNLLSA